MPNRVTIAQKAEIIKDIENGPSQSKIASKHQVTLDQVKYLAKKRKIQSNEESIQLSIYHFLTNSASAVPFQQLLDHLKSVPCNESQEFDSLWLKKFINQEPELKSKTVRSNLIS